MEHDRFVIVVRLFCMYRKTCVIWLFACIHVVWVKFMYFLCVGTVKIK